MLIDMLPQYYRKSKTVIDFFESIKNVLDEANAQIATDENEIFVITANDLTRHESEVGLLLTDTDKETLRSRVLSRLQGNGILTVNELIELVGKYENSEVEVKEDSANYTVSVVFPKRLKAPEKLNQIKAAVEEVKPAHIRVNYTFNEYASHLSLQQYKHGELRDYTHYQLRNEILSHVYNRLNSTTFECFILDGKEE